MATARGVVTTPAARRLALPLALLALLGVASFTPRVEGFRVPSIFRKGAPTWKDLNVMDYSDDEADLMDPFKPFNGGSRRSSSSGNSRRIKRRETVVTSVPQSSCKCLGPATQCRSEPQEGWRLKEALAAVCPMAAEAKEARLVEYCALATSGLKRSPLKLSKGDHLLDKPECPPRAEDAALVTDRAAVDRIIARHNLVSAFVAVRAASALLPLWKGTARSPSRDIFYTKGNAQALRGVGRHSDPFTKESTGYLPDEQPQLRYKSCAVVGNSGSLLQRQDAPEIDRHEFVIRVNQGPVLPNYAINTGEKTSARFLNRKFTQLYGTAHKRLQDVEPGGVKVIASQAAMKYFSALGSVMHSNKTLLFLNSEAVRDVTALLETFRLAFEQGTGILHEGSASPSAGFLAVQMASQLCDQVTVYGVSLSTPEPGCRNCPRHQYFDPRQFGLPGRIGPPPTMHNHDLEGWVLKAYHIMGIACVAPPPKGLGQCGSRLLNLTLPDGGLASSWPTVSELLDDSLLRELLERQPYVPPARPRQHEASAWVATPGFGVSRTVRFSKPSSGPVRRRWGSSGGPIIRT